MFPRRRLFIVLLIIALLGVGIYFLVRQLISADTSTVAGVTVSPRCSLNCVDATITLVKGNGTNINNGKLQLKRMNKSWAEEASYTNITFTKSSTIKAKLPAGNYVVIVFDGQMNSYSQGGFEQPTITLKKGQANNVNIKALQANQ